MGPVVRCIQAMRFDVMKEATDDVFAAIEKTKTALRELPSAEGPITAKVMNEFLSTQERVRNLEQELAEERAAHDKTKEEVVALKQEVVSRKEEVMSIKLEAKTSDAAAATSAAKVCTLAAQLASFVEAKRDLLRAVTTLKAMRAPGDTCLFSNDELKMVIHNCLMVDKEAKEDVLKSIFGA